MLIDLQGVSKRFGETTALDGVSFGVPEGSFTVLVGPSGCGKSTLLRLIAGLEHVTAGEISIGGRLVNEVAPKDRDIAMVFQNYALYPHKTVAQNMAFSLAMRDAPKAEIARAVAEAADILGLTDLLDRKPAALSGGQRQRVAMGRAIVRHPVAFLFDEPLSNLDAQLRAQMRGEIRALHKRLAATSIYVTHDQVEAMTMADKIVVLRGGRIEQVGAPLDLYDRPANGFVAEFLGNPGMNLLRATVTEARDAVQLSDGQRLRLGRTAPAQAGAAVLVGIRPEHLCASEEAAENAGLEIIVGSVETTGAEQSVVGSTAGQRLLVLLRDRRRIGPEDRLRLAAPPDRLHLFDPASGARLAG